MPTLPSSASNYIWNKYGVMTSFTMCKVGRPQDDVAGGGHVDDQEIHFQGFCLGLISKVQGEMDHPRGVHLLPPEYQDWVDQRDDFPPQILQFIRAIPCDYVDRTPRVDKDSSCNRASHLYFYNHRIIVRGSEVWASSSDEHHCRHRNPATLLSREDLLGTSKMGLRGGSSDALFVFAGDYGHYLHGAFLI